MSIITVLFGIGAIGSIIGVKLVDYYEAEFNAIDAEEDKKKTDKENRKEDK